MTGDLDLGGNKLIFDDLAFDNYANNWVRLVEKGTTTDRNLRVAELMASVFRSSVNQFVLGSRKTVDSTILVQAYNGTLLETVLQCVSANPTPYANIPLAGDIIPYGNDVASLGEAPDNYWLAIHCRTGWFRTVDCHSTDLKVYTDATRGAAGTAGKVIYNSDDNGLNIDDGTNWRDTDGNIT